MCRTTTNTNRWKSIDSVCLQFRLRGCDNLDQNLHLATLHTHFRSLRHQISFPALDGSILRCGISCHFCHRHGKLLQAGLILLDTIRRQHGGKLPTEHRTILCRHGHYQPFHRLLHLDLANSVNSGATNVYPQEGRCLWHHAPRRIVSPISHLPRLTSSASACQCSVLYTNNLLVSAVQASYEFTI